MSDFKPIFDHFLGKMTFLSRRNEKLKACIQALIFPLGEKNAVA
jgi:hypothetical protein